MSSLEGFWQEWLRNFTINNKIKYVMPSPSAQLGAAYAQQRNHALVRRIETVRIFLA